MRKKYFKITLLCISFHFNRIKLASQLYELGKSMLNNVQFANNDTARLAHKP